MTFVKYAMTDKYRVGQKKYPVPLLSIQCMNNEVRDAMTVLSVILSHYEDIYTGTSMTCVSVVYQLISECYMY